MSGIRKVIRFIIRIMVGWWLIRIMLWMRFVNLFLICE